MNKVIGLLSLNMLSLDNGSRRDCAEIEDSLRQLYAWAVDNVVGNDVFPRELPCELQRVMNQISECCQKISARIVDENQLKTEVIEQVLFANKRSEDADVISEECFYFARSLGAFAPSDGDCCEYSIYAAKRKQVGL